MKHTLIVLLALCFAGCGKGEEARKNLTSEETAEVIEKAIRKNIKKPSGELTEADLEKVEELNLSGTQISDAGLKELAELKNLNVLYLHANPITDEGLKELAKLERLILLQLNYTKVTKAGIMELKKSLPKCTFSR